MNDDADLLRDFVVRHNEASFRALVARRIGFVYAVNLRRLRNPHLAQEATQSVFIALARKAESVARGPSVLGWLHRSSCYESRNLMRAQVNRTARENEAQRLGTTTSDPAPAGPPGELEAVLDEVLGELSESDRDAILARFFSDRTFAELGAAANLSENAARMRVDRALDRLRARLQRRGLASTAAVLAAALPAYAAAAVPSGLSATTANTALATFGATAIPATFLSTMSTAKIITATAAVLATGFIGFSIQRNLTLESELTALHAQQAQAKTQLQDLQSEIATLRSAVPAGAPANPAPAATLASAKEPGPLEKPGVIRGAPAGWHKNGSKLDAFDVGVDQNEAWGGMPSAYAKSTSAEAQKEFGGVMQMLSAEQYRNQRVRLSGWIKTQDAIDGGGRLWLRVDGQAPGSRLGFDNMEKRAPTGTTDWEEYSIVLDVPNEASSLNYGFFLQGRGQVWVNAVTITPVGPEVPTTNMYDQRRELPKAPVNLGFKPAPKSGG